VFLPPSSAILFLYLCPSIAGMFLQRETVHEEEASLERMDVAEVRVGLYGDAIETGREQSYSMRITSHTSFLKDRQGDESGLSCSVVARSTKNTPDGFVGHAVISGNLAQGFVVFNDTAYHVRPSFRWNTVLRLTWTRILL
jgi:hypothetical protein